MKTLINLIQESNHAEDLRDAEKLLLEFEARFRLYKGLITESVETDKLFSDTTKMLAAAKRGLGIANKLKKPEDRKKNRSRIMGTMNKLRAQLKKIEKAIADHPPVDSKEFYQAERGTSTESRGRF